MQVKELLENIRVGEKTVLDVAGTPGDRKVTVELRKLHGEDPRPPVRKESPARVHEFLSAKSFADYLARYGSIHTVVFADPANEFISAVIDEMDEDGFEIVTMRPGVHPLWKPWADLSGQRMEIKDFAAHVAQNRRTIVEPDGRELALTLSQIRASVSVEVHVGRGANAVNGLVCKTRINGEGRDQIDHVELPETVKLSVPLYVDTSPREVELDLCVEASPTGEITVLVSGATVAEARVAAFADMIDVIRAGVKGLDATVTFGRPKHKAWDYLPELTEK